jgi:hypothetical protein
MSQLSIFDPDDTIYCGKNAISLEPSEDVTATEIIESPKVETYSGS